MARGIDHREKDAVLDAYRYGELPNWAIFAGNEPVVIYAKGDMSEGETQLGNYLTLVEESPTTTVYTLRIYDAATNKITNKSPYSCSTTFMLNQQAQLVPDKTGTMMVVANGTNRPPASNDSILLQRLDKLEAQNIALMKQLHDSEIKALNERLTTVINGISNATPPEKHWSDKLMDALAEDPKKLPETIGQIWNIFRPSERVNYITNPMGKTDKTNEDMKDTKEPVNEPIDEVLTEAEVTALEDRQDAALDILEDRLGIAEITGYLEELAAMDDETLGHWALQQGHIAKLNMRISPASVSKMVGTVAELNDKDLNKLLNHLE